MFVFVVTEHQGHYAHHAAGQHHEVEEEEEEEETESHQPRFRRSRIAHRAYEADAAR